MASSLSPSASSPTVQVQVHSYTLAAAAERNGNGQYNDDDDDEYYTSYYCRSRHISVGIVIQWFYYICGVYIG